MGQPLDALGPADSKVCLIRVAVGLEDETASSQLIKGNPIQGLIGASGSFVDVKA
jgi:hypothetical protein